MALDQNQGLALGGLADGIAKAVSVKHQREYDEKQKDHDLIASMVSAGLRDGTIKDPNAAFQFLLGGGSGKGKKGKDLPPMLQSLIGATGKLVGKGGGAKPSAQPQQEQALPQFLSADELTKQKQDAEIGLEKRRQSEITEPAAGAQHKRRLEEIAEQNKSKYGLGTLPGQMMMAYDAFVETNGRQPTNEEAIKIAEQVRDKWQGAGKKGTAEFTGANEQIAQQLKALHPDWSERQLSEGVAKESERRETLRERALTVRIENNAPSMSDGIIDAEKPDPATANIPNKVTGLTPNAIYQDAVSFALKGTLPSFGLGSALQVRASRTAIQNKAAALAAATGVDLPTLQAEYRANSTALNRLVPYYQMTEAFAETAKKNLDLAETQSAKVPRTKSPIVNRYAQWVNGQQLVGNPELTRFETYIYTAAREYAKVTSGAATSAAGLTDSAAREAEKLLNAAQTPQAFQAAVDAMQNDMDNVRSSYQNQIRNVSGVIGQFLGLSGGSGGPKVESWVRDPKTGLLKKQ